MSRRMQVETAGSLLLFGNSQLTRELCSVLVKLDLEVKRASTAAEAVAILRTGETDLLVVEVTAVGHSGIGLAELAEAARDHGTRLALLTSRSPLETAACASLLGAIASLNKWMSVRVTAQRLLALLTNARCSRDLGIVFDHEVPWVENDEAIATFA
jgi:DNA-binding response OmpR family regulator